MIRPDGSRIEDRTATPSGSASKASDNRSWPSGEDDASSAVAVVTDSGASPSTVGGTAPSLPAFSRINAESARSGSSASGGTGAWEGLSRRVEPGRRRTRGPCVTGTLAAISAPITRSAGPDQLTMRSSVARPSQCRTSAWPASRKFGPASSSPTDSPTSNPVPATRIPRSDKSRTGAPKCAGRCAGRSVTDRSPVPVVRGWRRLRTMALLQSSRNDRGRRAPTDEPKACSRCPPKWLHSRVTTQGTRASPPPTPL